MDSSLTAHVCATFFAGHADALRRMEQDNPYERRSLTLSRQAGARGRTLGLQLTHWLGQHDLHAPTPWALFDKDLITRCLEDHNLPEYLEHFLPEDRYPEVQSILGEWLHLHPSHWELLERVNEAMVHLATFGSAIIVGRGGNMLTAHLPHVAHVRLVGSLEHRVHWMAKSRGLAEETARTLVDHEDRARRRYFKTYFSRDIDDPCLYDLVLNTDGLSDSVVVDSIGRLVMATPPAYGTPASMRALEIAMA